MAKKIKINLVHVSPILLPPLVWMLTCKGAFVSCVLFPHESAGVTLPSGSRPSATQRRRMERTEGDASTFIPVAARSSDDVTRESV